MSDGIDDYIEELRAARQSYANLLGCEVGDIHESIRGLIRRIAELEAVEQHNEVLCKRIEAKQGLIDFQAKRINDLENTWRN